VRVLRNRKHEYKGKSRKISFHSTCSDGSRDREMLWTSFKEDAATSTKREQQTEKMIKIVKKFKFAGEEFTYGRVTLTLHKSNMRV
jgi:hypothetical protein